MNGNDGGTRRILFWIMGALLAVSMAGATATLTWINNRLTALEVSDSIGNERSKVNEARLNAMEAWLGRIEAKIDKVLERIPNGQK